MAFVTSSSLLLEDPGDSVEGRTAAPLGSTLELSSLIESQTDMLVDLELIVKHELHLALAVEDIGLSPAEHEEVFLDAELVPDLVALVDHELLLHVGALRALVVPHAHHGRANSLELRRKVVEESVLLLARGSVVGSVEVDDGGLSLGQAPVLQRLGGELLADLKR